MGMSISPLTVAIIYEVDGRDTNPPGTTSYNRPRSDYADAVAAVTKSLQDLGHIPVAVGDFYNLVTVLSSTPQPGWDLAMNLAGGIRGVAKEAQVPAILEAYGIPFTFGHSLVMAISADKSKTKVCLPSSDP
jgi:D-alanine-D-alanine ligase